MAVNTEADGGNGAVALGQAARPVTVRLRRASPADGRPARRAVTAPAGRSAAGQPPPAARARYLAAGPDRTAEPDRTANPQLPRPAGGSRH